MTVSLVTRPASNMNEGRRYRVALVGLGARGYKTYFECLQRSASVTIAAICDNNKSILDSFASQHPDIPAYRSIGDLLQAHRPDFAIVSVPNKFHVECVTQLSAAGVPTLKEKPVAESAAEFKYLCQLPTKTGVVFQRRWQPRYVDFKSMLPKIGKIVSVRATLAGHYDPAAEGWRVMDQVGTFEDLGVHMLDIIVWLFGRPSVIQGYRVSEEPLQVRDRESHVYMKWSASSIVCHLYVSEVASGKEESLSVRGQLGSLCLAANGMTHHDAQGKLVCQMELKAGKDDAIRSMCKEFGEYVSGVSESFSTSIAQTADTLATSEAVRISFASGESILTAQTLAKLCPPPNRRVNEVKFKVEEDPFITQKQFLLNTGDRIPGVGFGTRKPKKPLQVYDAVKMALRIGYRHIDTAYRYNNEDQVGNAVRDSRIPREEVWITTKIDNSWHHRVAESVDLSLEALGMNYLDLVLMHWPCPVSPDDPKKAMPDWDFIQTWQDMQSLVKTGKVRNIGVSNFGIRKLKELLSHPTCRIVPAVNQIELHPYCPMNPVLDFCREKGIHCMAYSPLACGLPELYDDASITELCNLKSKTPQQILIRWGLQRGTSVIPKSVNPDRIAANFDLDGWSMNSEEHGLLSNLGTRIRVYPDDWLPGQAFTEEDDE